MLAALRAAFAAALLFAYAAPARAGDLSGVWTGAYVCAQGETGLSLTIRAVGSRLWAVFAFSAVPENPDVPSGAFEMTGRLIQGRSVSLNAGEWLDWPAGYETVDLRGEMRIENGIEVIEGRVLFDPAPGACTTFRVERRPGYVS